MRKPIHASKKKRRGKKTLKDMEEEPTVAEQFVTQTVRKRERGKGGKRGKDQVEMTGIGVQPPFSSSSTTNPLERKEKKRRGRRIRRPF